MWGNMHGYGGGGLFLFIIGLLIIGLIVWAVLASSRGGRSIGMGQPRGQAPLDIAKERYARGEIAREQFDEIKKGLQ